jgi:DNA processing protein
MSPITRDRFREMTSQILDEHDQSHWEKETVALLSLAHLPKVSYWTLYKLASSGVRFRQVLKAESIKELNSYGTLDFGRVLNINEENWSKERLTLWERGKSQYQQLKQKGIQVIHHGQPTFPKALQGITDPPRWLFVEGDPNILHKPAIAIVGTRNPTDDGLFLAKYIGSCLDEFSAVTVSGLALGIDQIVHENSVRFKVPTIAVLGTGILKNYPANSESLRRTIRVNGGVIITEYLPNQSYSAENFVRRNRLQSGLARVVVPVEWKAKSGTAHTVNFASREGRKIVCLRMPDWKENTHSELSLGQELGAVVFTLPKEHSSFISAIREGLELGVPSQKEEIRTYAIGILVNPQHEQKSDSEKKDVQLNILENLVQDSEGEI